MRANSDQPSSVSRAMRFFCALVVPAALVVFALPGSPASADGAASPTITSDQTDYAPGSQVTLTGAGWSAGESVHVTVDDNDGQSWHFADDVTADSSGTFVDQLTLPNWFVANYVALATGSAGESASTSFTDSNVLVTAVKSGTNTNVVADVTWTVFKKDATCTGTPQSSGVVTTGNSPVKTSGVGQTTGMSLLAQQNIVSGSTIWAFSNWTGGVAGTSNPLCVPGDTSGGTIREVANYVDTGVPAASRQAQSIDFAVISDVSYPHADIPLTATATSNLAVSYVAGPSTVCAITSAPAVQIVGVGDCTVTASQGGNSSYLAATDVSRTFTVSPAGTTVTVNCPATQVYTGLAQTPCSATATAAGGFSQDLSVTYSADNTDVGTVTASASFAGDATHSAGSGSNTFGITQAASTVTITCDPATYTGSALTPCSATAGGPGLGTSGVAVTPLTYGTNVNAGTNSATVSATWAGDANHTGNTASTTFSIAKASTTTTITCTTPVIYTGSPIAACGSTAAVTGANLSGVTTAVTYPGNHTDAATGIEADASYAGDANHLGSSAVQKFDITQASSVVSFTCHDVTYDTTAQTPCIAQATGVGGVVLQSGLPVTYSNNINAGQAGASASWDGNANYSGSSSTANFTVNKADTSITLNCDSTSVYDGTAQRPCSATLNGPGLGGSLGITYAGNVDAGINTATADASYAGDDNHNGSSAHATFSIAQASSGVTVDCSGAFVYNGSSQQPCTASVSGAGVVTGTATITYPADTTDAGTINVSASYAGDANHTGSSNTGSYVIAKADTTTTVTCLPSTVTYTGDPQTPCTAHATGPGSLNASLTVLYADNINATDSASASAAYSATANYNGSNDTQHFVISRAPSTTVVTCPAHVTFTGSALTPCTASATGAGDLSSGVDVTPVTYTNNTHVGSAGASATYGGDVNHTDSTGTGGFAIDKAAVTVAVNCPTTPVVFTGSALEMCTASVSGPGLTTQSLTPSYSNNVNAGTNTASASASYAGDPDHNSGSGSATFSIAKADTTTTVTCNGPQTYSGAPIAPCSALVTGPALSQTLDVTYGDNTDASTSVSATAAFAGDANHNASSGSASFVIGQATSTTTVNCPAHATYTGSALTPCTATATGVGDLSGGVAVTPVTYANNTEVGSATASATYAGNPNHSGSTGNGGFIIDKADVTVTVNCPTSGQTYTGSAQTPCSASVSGPGLATQSLPVTYANNKNVGTNTASASASYAGDPDHNTGSGSATFSITKAPLTVTADNKSMTYGDNTPPLTYQVGTFLGTDTQANSTSGTPTCWTTATPSSPATGTGTPAAAYSITCDVSAMSSSNYAISAVPGVMTVHAKSATLYYNGALMFATPVGGNTASATLSGQLTPGSGGNPNLTNAAPVTFYLYKSSNLTMATADVICTAPTVSASGGFNCTVSNLTVDNWTVIVHLGLPTQGAPTVPGNAYFAAGSSDPVVVTVYTPATDQFATGGGWVTDPSASVPTNTHGNFGFTVRYSKSGSSTPSGQSVFTYRANDGYDYVVKSNSWQGGALAFGPVSTSTQNVSFSGKANITVINRATGQVMTNLSQGNATYRVDAFDSGSSGTTTDSYAITVYTSGGVLFHQAGTTNSQLALGGGNIVIHAK